jgi:AraC family transcriptional activator of mtrCDE
MTINLSEYLLRDFVIERASAQIFQFGSVGGVRFPTSTCGYFHLVLSGKARISVDGSKEAIDLQAGQCAMLLYGVPHRVSNTHSTPLLHTCDHWPFTDSTPAMRLGSGAPEVRILSASVQLARTLLSAPVNRALPHLLYSAPDSRPLCQMTAIEPALQGSGAAALVLPLAQMYLTQLLRQATDELHEVFTLHYGAVEMGRLVAVIRRLRDHPERRWTVASLAREIGWSRSTFAAKFQAYAGIGPIKYAAKMRLTKAEAILRSDPDFPLWEVARRVGYGVKGSFTRAFKAQYGVSPSKYVSRLQTDKIAGKTES